ncbi:hypothetical protein OAB57_02325 [Bacteriovoracaceae bacterium]|nr:hypothetical protein [Bacteriovoracaceae bacterium]
MPNTSILRCLYIGNDTTFWEQFAKELQETLSQINFDLIQYKVLSANQIKPLIPDIIKQNVNVIFIDHSQYPEHTQRLTLFLRRETVTKRAPIIGLFDNVESVSLITGSLIAGGLFNFIKKEDCQNLITQVANIIQHDHFIQTEFTKSSTEIQLIAHVFSKIGYMSSQKIHFESCMDYKVGDIIPFETNIFVKRPETNAYIILEKGYIDLYSPANFWYQIHFIPFEQSIHYQTIIKDLPQDFKKSTQNFKGPQKTLYAQLLREEKEYNERTKNMVQRRSDWISKATENSSPKRTKILVVEKKLSILFQGDKLLDQYPFAIRIISQISECDDEITRFFPGIIAFCLEYTEDDSIYLKDITSVEELKSKISESTEAERCPTQAPYLDICLTPPVISINGIISLKKLVMKIKNIATYSPIIMIFSSKEKTELLKSYLDYDHLICVSDDISLETLSKLAESYKVNKGRDTTHDRNLSMSKIENRYYFDKFDPQSIISYPFNINVISISEVDIRFTSKIPLNPYINIYIKDPIGFNITVVPWDPQSSDAEENQYYGLISGVTEVQLMEIRRLVNKLIGKKSNS